MIAVDTNLLVYSHRADAPFHVVARDIVAGLAEDTSRWAIPWPCIHEFLGNVTNPRIYKLPTPLDKATEQVETWLGSPGLRLLGETNDYWETLRGLLDSSQVVGAKVHDARVAAICLSHGVLELLTADRDFSRFGGLKVRNPLRESD